jgi:hypothetical protein
VYVTIVCLIQLEMRTENIIILNVLILGTGLYKQCIYLQRLPNNMSSPFWKKAATGIVKTIIQAPVTPFQKHTNDQQVIPWSVIPFCIFLFT